MIPSAFYTTGLLALSSLVTAGPVETFQLDKRQIGIPGGLLPISFPDFNTIALYEQYAAAAYCGTNFNNASATTTLVCNQRNCDLAMTARVTPGSKFFGTRIYGTSGYVAIDDPKRLIILAFEGTDPNNSRQVLADRQSANNFTAADFLCTGCKVPGGFLGAYKEVQTLVTNLTITAQGLFDKYQVVVTGHSLGGSLAIIAALDLRKRGISVHLATYGAPRTLNPIGANTAVLQDDKKKNRNFRVSHVNDQIPNFVLAAVGGQHITPSFLITSDNVTPPIPATVLIVPNDITNPTTNIFQLAGAHGSYFNPISACTNSTVYLPLPVPLTMFSVNETASNEGDLTTVLA